MDYKELYTGGEPQMNENDFMRMQLSTRAAMHLLAKGFGDENTSFIITGCEVTTPAAFTYDITSGLVLVNGEILTYDGQTGLNIPGGSVAYFTKNVTYEAGGDKTYNDGIFRQTWRQDKAILTVASSLPAGAINILNPNRFSDIVQNVVTSNLEASTAQAKALAATGLYVSPATLGDVTGGTLTKVLNIGDWNMDVNPSTSVVHGLTLAKIVGVSVLIKDDSDTNRYNLVGQRGIADPGTVGGAVSLSATDVDLFRVTGGYFDAPDFDATSFNRGFIIIQYQP